MESTLVRGFVLFLVLAGFGASSVTPHTPVGRTGVKAHDGLPLCPWNDPNHCGIDAVQ